MQTEDSYRFSPSLIGSVVLGFVLIVGAMIFFLMPENSGEKNIQYSENSSDSSQLKKETGSEIKDEIDKKTEEKIEEGNPENSPLKNPENSEKLVKNSIENSEKDRKTHAPAEESRLYSAALEKNDALGCEKLDSEKLRKSCRDDLVFSASLANSTLSGCDEISDILKQKSCKNEIKGKQIIEDKDFAQCKNLEAGSVQKKCFRAQEKFLFSTAKTKSDCREISDSKLQDACLVRMRTPDDFAFSPFACNSEKLNAEEKMLCQRMTISSSLSRGKKIQCSVFSGEILEFCILESQRVLDMRWHKKAIKSSEYGYCQKISNEKMKNGCQDLVAFNRAWEEKDTAFCSVIHRQILKKKCNNEQGEKISNFFYAKAMRGKNKKLCLMIPDIALLKKCISYLEK